MPTNTTVETHPDTATSLHSQGDSSKQPTNSDPGGATADGSKPVFNEPPVLC